MTYVVGVRRFGVAAIICDSDLSIPGDARRDPAIKHGILGNGLIYGMSGGWNAAVAFIQDAKARCTAETAAENFQILQERVRLYPYRPGENNQFDVLISSRHSAAPQFFWINSRTEDMQPDGGTAIGTLGSGTVLLNRIAHRFGWTHVRALDAEDQSR